MGRYSTATGGGGDFVQAPAGSHVARCIKIIDLGTQTSEYQGVQTVKNQILISWELSNETTEIDGIQKPFIVSKFLTNSLNKKANLRALLVSWRGRDFTDEELARFDLETILGAPCILSVVHNSKDKATVEGVMKLAKGMDCPKAFNPLFSFWLGDFDKEKFNSLSDGLKQIIMKSPEYQVAVGNVASDANDSFETCDIDSDIPF